MMPLDVDHPALDRAWRSAEADLAAARRVQASAPLFRTPSYDLQARRSYQRAWKAKRREERKLSRAAAILDAWRAKA